MQWKPYWSIDNSPFIVYWFILHWVIHCVSVAVNSIYFDALIPHNWLFTGVYFTEQLYKLTVYVFQLLSTQSMTSDISEQVLRNLLLSVHMHGQYDFDSVKLYSSINNIYELLRPQFSESLTTVLLQIPGVDIDKIKVCHHVYVTISMLWFMSPCLCHHVCVTMSMSPCLCYGLCHHVYVTMSMSPCLCYHVYVTMSRSPCLFNHFMDQNYKLYCIIYSICGLTLSCSRYRSWSSNINKC